MNTSTASLEVYHALVRAGIKDDEADNLAKTIISRAEVEDTLPSKQDLQLLREELRDELSTTTRWLISVFKCRIPLVSLKKGKPLNCR